MALTVVLGLAVLLSQAQDETIKIGEIEFFGSAGINLPRIRSSLPVHEGDTLSSSTFPKFKADIKASLEASLGHPPTDIATICCDEQHRLSMYLGLGGRSSEDIAYDPPPTGTARLPADLVKLWNQTMQAMAAAVKKGDADEDHSKGYALGHEPALRALQLQLRAYAVTHEPAIRAVLSTSKTANQRAIAAQALGYANQSPEQIAALVKASRDVNEDVRNNAVRALGVLAATGADIPAGGFVEMLNSGIWTDRNKGSMLLLRLTDHPNPELIAELRADALDSLVEMARWRNKGHAYMALVLLGRMAGMNEAKLQDLANRGQADAIIEAIQRLP